MAKTILATLTYDDGFGTWRLFRGTPAGGWTEVVTSTGSSPVHVSYGDDVYVFTTDANFPFYRSDDGGSTFDTVTPSGTWSWGIPAISEDGTIWLLGGQPPGMTAVTNCELWKSTDRGDTWSLEYTPPTQVALGYSTNPASDDYAVSYPMSIFVTGDVVWVALNYYHDHFTAWDVFDPGNWNYSDHHVFRWNRDTLAQDAHIALPRIRVTQLGSTTDMLLGGLLGLESDVWGIIIGSPLPGNYWGGDPPQAIVRMTSASGQTAGDEPQSSISAIALADAATAYIVGGGTTLVGGVWQTENLVSWTLLKEDAAISNSDILYDSEGVLWVTGYTTGTVWRSLDAGVTWTPHTIDAAAAYVRSLSEIAFITPVPGGRRGWALFVGQVVGFIGGLLSAASSWLGCGRA